MGAPGVAGRDRKTRTMLALGIALSVLVGVSLGMLGGGGSILSLPILVYVLGLDAHEGIATSLLVVGVTSSAALVPHAREGRVRVGVGASFGLTSMAGAYGAGRLAHALPAGALLVGFGILMVVAGGAMLRPRREGAGELPRTRAFLAKVLALGVAVGAVTGLVGAGGGFIVVPALALLAGLPMSEAVATSLLVIALNSFAALAAHASSVSLNPTLAASVTGAAVAGSLLGARLAGRVPPELLRRAFGWFVLVMAAFVLSQEIARAFGLPFSLGADWPWVLLATLVPLVAALVDLVRARAAVEAKR